MTPMPVGTDMQAPAQRLRVAIVAPSLRILGGQSVQADWLLRGWEGDPRVEAWLVPHNPLLPRPLRWLTHIKYVRTLVTEAAYLWTLLAEVRRADVVHIFSASYTSFLLAPLPALLVGELFGLPVLLNYHSGEAPDHLRRSRVARRAIARASRVVVPSRFLRQVFADVGISAEVVANVAPLESFRFRQRQPLRPRLLSTRNLEPLYDVGCTLRAFARVQASRPDASLTIVGSGSQASQLQALATSLDLRHVRFVGRVPPDAMPGVYAEHDLYVQSPTIDNMPLSVLEAFASGLPVVSTDAGGVPTILRDGIDGRLVPVGDAEALARAIRAQLDAPDTARTMARAARATLDAYSWPVVREDWLQVYRELAALRAPRAEAVRA